MEGVAQRREEIYDYFHANAACQQYFFDSSHEDEYVAYYNSMYLLFDTTEALWQHREHGFSRDPLLAYIEFWGVMQAAIIQQDSIAENHQVVVGKSLDPEAAGLASWQEIRRVRNTCAGHPARRDKPKRAPMTRTFMGRAFGNYDSITYEQWQQGVGMTHPRIQLGALFDAYAIEVELQLANVLAAMKQRWP